MNKIIMIGMKEVKYFVYGIIQIVWIIIQFILMPFFVQWEEWKNRQ